MCRRYSVGGAIVVAVALCAVPSCTARFTPHAVASSDASLREQLLSLLGIGRFVATMLILIVLLMSYVTLTTLAQQWLGVAPYGFTPLQISGALVTMTATLVFSSAVLGPSSARRTRHTRHTPRTPRHAHNLSPCAPHSAGRHIPLRTTAPAGRTDHDHPPPLHRQSTTSSVRSSRSGSATWPSSAASLSSATRPSSFRGWRTRSQARTPRHKMDPRSTRAALLRCPAAAVLFARCDALAHLPSLAG
jgi:hypothetical protein